jgi:hypothetical protein
VLLDIQKIRASNPYPGICPGRRITADSDTIQYSLLHLNCNADFLAVSAQLVKKINRERELCPPTLDWKSTFPNFAQINTLPKSTMKDLKEKISRPQSQQLSQQPPLNFHSPSFPQSQPLSRQLPMNVQLTQPFLSQPLSQLPATHSPQLQPSLPHLQSQPILQSRTLTLCSPSMVNALIDAIPLGSWMTNEKLRLFILLFSSIFFRLFIYFLH